MKKTNKLLSLLLLAIPSVLLSCETTSTTNLTTQNTTQGESSSSSTSSQTNTTSDVKERHFVLKEFNNIKQGTIIDLNDFVSVVPGTNESYEERQDYNFDYEIYSDESSSALVSTYSETTSKPSIYKSKKLVISKPGYQVLKLTSRDLEQYISFEIQPDEAIDQIKGFFDEHGENYKVLQNFNIDSSLNVTEVENGEPILYKGENFYFNASSHYGYIYHSFNNDGYPFLMDSLDKVDTFKLLPNGLYTTTKTLGDFESTYPNLNTYFTSSNLEYTPYLEETYGEEYKYAIPYNSSTKTLCTNIFTSLGLSYSQVINSSYYYNVYIIPVVKNNKVNIYTLAMNTTYRRVLEGPYVLDDISDLNVQPIEDFLTDEVPNNDIAAGNTIATKLSGMESYTVDSTIEYLDMSGKIVDTPSSIQSWLPSGDYSLKVDLTNGIETNFFHFIDQSSEYSSLTNAILLNKDNTTILYDTSSGTATEVGTYYNKVWTSDSDLNLYRPTVGFQASNFRNASYYNENGLYLTGALNDSASVSAMTSILGSLTCDYFANSSSPFYYYSSYAYMTINLGDTLTDDVNGDIYAYFPLNNGVKLHFNFKISNINNTIVALPTSSAE